MIEDFEHELDIENIPIPDPFENLDEWEDSIEEREEAAFEMAHPDAPDDCDMILEYKDAQEIYDPWEGETDPENPLDELADENDEFERISDLSEREEALKATGYGYENFQPGEADDDDSTVEDYADDPEDQLEKLKEVQGLELEARRIKAQKVIDKNKPKTFSDHFKSAFFGK